MPTMRFESSLVKPVEASKSLRTTVPQFVVALLGVEEGDALVWLADPKTGKVLVSAGSKKSSRRD